MPAISQAAFHAHVNARRSVARLLAICAAAALAAALMPAAALAKSPESAKPATTSGDWSQFRNDPVHSGYNVNETMISASNVAALGVAWTGTDYVAPNVSPAATTGPIDSSPAIADGVAYVGSLDGKLYAFAVDCASGGGTCMPLWTGATGDMIESSPAVRNGVVYVGSDDHKVYAFAVGCNTGGGTCTPIWSGATGSGVRSSPTVVNGVVYVASFDHMLYAFAAGCNSGGGTCTPLWTGITGNVIDSSPAVANGAVFVESDDGHLYAFAVGCRSDGGACPPLWTGDTPAAVGISSVTSSPAVADGVVYVGSWDSKLYAFAVGCRSDGGACPPLWTATTGGVVESSPAVANGVVYVGSGDKLYAFAVGCNSGGGSCTPLWTATTGGYINSSPEVANGVVYVGSDDGKLYAYAVGCASGGGTCTPLWTGTTGDMIVSSPAVSNGVVYVQSFDGKLYAFSLYGVSGATYHALTPTRILDSRDHTGGLGIFSSHVAQTFQVTGHGGVPSNAIAVTGNLTVTGQTSGGFLYIGPVAMNNPTSSTLNFPVGDDRANAVTVALATGGTLSVTYAAASLGPTANVIFDVTGYFTPDATGAKYVALNPTRLLDSRNGTGLTGAFSSHLARTFGVTGGLVPSSATAVTGNLTVTQQTSAGFLFIGPVAMNNPTSSTLNFPLGDDRANAVTVALGTGGTLSVTYAASTLGPTAHVIFDVTGYFVP